MLKKLWWGPLISPTDVLFSFTPPSCCCLGIPTGELEFPCKTFSKTGGALGVCWFSGTDSPTSFRPSDLPSSREHLSSPSSNSASSAVDSIMFSFHSETFTDCNSPKLGFQAGASSETQTR
ncbi:hypothetical protein HanRHA438_Chr13g0613191 [Helianthus annuus]|nr:hypothetical protein HanRHA438_Chr13g0613191 [Helianthus annuus]